METVKEMQKRALIRDIEEVIAEQECTSKEEMNQTESRYMGGEEYMKHLDRIGAANFAIGFLGALKENISDRGIKESVLLLRWHLHSQQKCAKSGEPLAYECYKLSLILERLVEDAEARREWETGPAIPAGRYGVYWFGEMDYEAMIAACDSLDDACGIARAESSTNESATMMSVYDRETNAMLALYEHGALIGELNEAV